MTDSDVPDPTLAETLAKPDRQRVARTDGAFCADEPVRARKRRPCDGHLAEPHWIEVGDLVFRSALPPNHSDIGNTGWWHASFCADCAPEAATR